jgi:uncharacterized RDD family membrane protein YckC
VVPYGGFWWRVLAFLIDTIILYIATGIIGSLLGIGIAPLAGIGASQEVLFGTTFLAIQALNFVINWLYYALLESSGWQATIGKMVIGLVVTGPGGKRISFLRATGRYFAKFISTFILLIGFIMVAFTSRKQGLHDMMANTIVYKTRNAGAIEDHKGVFA